MIYLFCMSIKDSVTEFFSGLKNKKSDTFVGIDIGSSYIKIVQLKKEKGRILLDTYGSIALGPYQDEGFSGQLTNLEAEKITEALQNLLEQANVTAKSAVISVSSSTSLIFVLKVPPVTEKELAGVIQNEARKYIPVPLSEISLDWWVIPQREMYDTEGVPTKRETEVLVTAVRNEVVFRYNTIAESIGAFRDVRLEIETFSAARGSLKHELSPVMLLDFGASGVRMAIIEHGIVRKFRAVNRGSAFFTNTIQKSLNVDFAEAENLKKQVGLNRESPRQEVYSIIQSGMQYIFSEIQNVIFDFEKTHQKPLSKIILAGGGSRLHSLKDEIESRYNIFTAFADPFSKASAPDFLDDVLSKAGPEFAVALGLALQGVE